MALPYKVNLAAVGAAAGPGTSQSLGGIAESGFLEGQQRVEAENDKQKEADQRERDELDATFGDLQAEDSGNESYDAETEIMAKEWKSQFAALNAMKDEIPPGEYIQQKHEILGRAKELNKANVSLAKFASDYFEAESQGSLSKSTPANIRLLADALKNGGDVRITNNPETGKPHLMGIVAGEEVDVPISQIASGKNQFRFNMKFDSDTALEGLSKRLELANLTEENVKDRSRHEVDKLLDNESTIRAIAADELGINPAEYSDADPAVIKEQVAEYLKARLETEYLPKQLTAAQNATVTQGNQKIAIAQQKTNIAQQGVNLQKEQLAAQQQGRIDSHNSQQQQIADFPFTDDPVADAQAISASFGIPLTWNKKKKTFQHLLKGKVISNIGSDVAAVRRFIANELGVGFGKPSTAVTNPVKRLGPLKRLSNWLKK